MFAAPKQASTTARRRPWVNPSSNISTVTGPPRLTPAAQSGRSTDGNVNSTVPGQRTPKSIWSTIRNTITTTPSRRNKPNEPAHGASVAAATT